jgi:RNA polymerase sigma factor (sigma-70 family)
MPESRNELYARLFSESRAALCRYVRRFIGSGETAQEIVQEAFLRTYEQGDVVKTPRAFLFSTARNLASNEHRHRRIAKTDTMGDFDDLCVVPPCGSLEESALADERTRLIQDAVDRLPPQCRAAFTLRVFHGCSYKEIGTRLGISTKTVEKHIARGLHDTHVYMKRRYMDVEKGHG